MLETMPPPPGPPIAADTGDEETGGRPMLSEPQYMWKFHSLWDALMGFTEGQWDYSNVESSEVAEESDSASDEDNGKDDEKEEDNEEDNEEDDDTTKNLEAIGRFPTLQQLQKALRDASSFWHAAPPADLPRNTRDDTAQISRRRNSEPNLEQEQTSTPETESDAESDSGSEDYDEEFESIGRLPSLQQLQAALRNASNYVPSMGLPSGRPQELAAGLQKRLARSMPTDSDHQPLGTSGVGPMGTGKSQNWNYGLPQFEQFQKIWTYPHPVNAGDLFSKWWSPPSKQQDTSGHHEHAIENDHTLEEGNEISIHLTDQEKQKSYGSDGGLGCKHYLRNCKVQCPDCQRFYPCRLCHDEQETTHTLPRKRVVKMLCMVCLYPQRAAEYCANCHELMADFYCDVCKLWSDDPEKPIFHCDKCGICRVGHGLGIDTFHCDNCGICMDLMLENNHRCVPSNSSQSDCPICLDDLFHSTLPIVIMPCGHPIHKHCFDEYSKNFYRCPVCSRSVLNTSALFRLIDDEVRREVLPPELANLEVDIQCHDCLMRTRTKFHLAGLKCAPCGSYNTTKV